MANTMISKMAESWIIDDDVSLSDDEGMAGGDLSSWELINHSDDETLDFSFSSSSSEEEAEDEDQNDAVSVPESLSSEISLPKKLPKKLPVRLLNRFGYSHSFNYYYDRDADVDAGDEEGDEYDSSDGLDDELVPRSVSGRLGRNRMRKVGKREYSRMARSKKLPAVYNRPGCVHGKHGLGLKHSLM